MSDRHYPLCFSVADVLSRLPEQELGELHPGLLLDRLIAYPTGKCDEFDQEKGQKPQLDSVACASQNPSAHRPALSQWDRLVEAMHPRPLVWRQQTIWRLALHLSRGSALENGSICLHPIYGFAHLPGTGLKGLARAYAETCADDAKQADIQRVFGHSRQGSGTVIFLDAWPETWPELELDIVNSHHRQYYENCGKDSPPGDWESPNPVYFLAVPPSTAFRFALAPVANRAGAQQDAVRAREWLQAALQELGAGAKTAAGYGYFGPPLPELEAAPSAGASLQSDADPMAVFAGQLQRYSSIPENRRAQQRHIVFTALDQLQAQHPALLPQAMRMIEEGLPDVARSEPYRKRVAAFREGPGRPGAS